MGILGMTGGLLTTVIVLTFPMIFSILLSKERVWSRKNVFNLFIGVIGTALGISGGIASAMI